jgi:hypothetical protein
MGMQILKPRIVIGIVGIVILLTPYYGIGQEAPIGTTQSIPQKLIGNYDGESLNLQFVAEGIGKRKCIPITRTQVSRVLRSPGGATLGIITKHRWKTAITLKEFDADGIKAYSIEGMVAEQRGKRITKALLPMGPGTIYRVIGDVKLLGHTIKGDKSAPLIFVIHNVSNSKEADASFATEGPLVPIKFAFDDKMNPKPEEPKDVQRSDLVYLQLVHLEGKGSATFEGGETVEFQ